MAYYAVIDLAAIPAEMMENIWHFIQVGGVNPYVRNDQLTKELYSEKNNFFSLLVRENKIVHSFWWNLDRYIEKDLYPQYPSVLLQGIRCSMED